MIACFVPTCTKKAIEEGKDLFSPLFDKDGLLTAVVTCQKNNDLLMVAYMNAEAVSLTLRSRIAHFWSRSRKSLWKKGESSGNFLQIKEMFIDCDQDVLWLKVFVAGKGVACHTGERSCFYRQIHVKSDTIKLVRSISSS